MPSPVALPGHLPVDMISPPAPGSPPSIGSQVLPCNRTGLLYNSMQKLLQIICQRKRGSTKDSVGLYAVQCCDCYKWRMVPTKEEFETIRESFTEDPWFCSRRPDCSCEQPAGIEYDSSRIWIIDKPNIPKPPPDTERLVIMRRDYSKMDTYYVMPNGKRARCSGDVDKFLEAHPEYKDRISVSSFSFAPPKIVEETVSHNTAWKAAKVKKQDKADAFSGQK